MKKFSLLISFLMLFSAAFSQDSPVGVWKTIDDESGEAKSHVEIYKKDGKFEGKVVKLLKAAKQTTCTECSGDKKNKPIEGMVIIEDLEPYKYYWANGEILDPKSGSTYSCSAWFENKDPDKLFVRGKHWTGLYRTQTWYRVK
jgi:uncharacterized protein (DUF2147 family)